MVNSQAEEAALSFAQKIQEFVRTFEPGLIYNKDSLILFMYEKHFQDWMALKEKLEFKISPAPHVSEGEIWWASIGENVGFEISGKSEKFTRPVVILRKLTHNFYLVAPTSTQPKTGSWFVKIRQSKKEMVVCLQQIRTIDYRRLYTRIGELDKTDFQRVKENFMKIYV